MYKQLTRVAAQYPDKIAFQSVNGKTLSYSSFLQLVDDTAEELMKNGILPESIVALHFQSSIEYVLLAYSVWKCGSVLVSVPPELDRAAKNRILNISQCDFVISYNPDIDFGKFNTHQPLKADYCEASIITLEKTLGHNKRDNQIADLLSGGYIRFTSGTTGSSKGVYLSPKTILERVRVANEVLKISEQDTVLNLLPTTYHLAVSLVNFINSAATICISEPNRETCLPVLDNRLIPSVIYGSAREYECLLTNSYPLFDLSQLRYAICTADVTPVELSEKFFNLTGKYLSPVYGMIEIGLPFMNINPDPQHLDSVGRIIPGFCSNYLNTELGDEYKLLSITGEGMYDGYISDLGFIVRGNGSFETGDIVTKDPNDGYVRIKGRSAEIIEIAGDYFLPQIVEDIIKKNHLVSDAVVYKTNSKMSNPYLSAQVILKAPNIDITSDLQKLCSEYLKESQVPTKFHYVKEIPRTANNKYLRREII